MTDFLPFEHSSALKKGTDSPIPITAVNVGAALSSNRHPSFHVGSFAAPSPSLGAVGSCNNNSSNTFGMAGSQRLDSCVSNQDILDPFYSPPIWVRRSTAAVVLAAAESFEDAMSRVRSNVRLRSDGRSVDISRIRDRISALKASSALAANPSAEFVFGGFEAVPSALQPSPPHALSAADGNCDVASTDPFEPADSAIGRAFSLAGTGGAADSRLRGLSIFTPTDSERMATPPPPSASPSPWQVTSRESGVTSPVPSANACLEGDGVAALLAVSGEASLLASSCAARIGSSLECTDRLLSIFAAEFRGRMALVAEEATASGVRATMPLTEEGVNTDFALASLPPPSCASDGAAVGACAGTLMHAFSWLTAKARVVEAIALATLHESTQRAAIDREYSTFMAWAHQSEPQWRAGVQRAVRERLARESEAAAAEASRRAAEELRQQALAAMANEKATEEARRVAEVARLRAEELALAKRLREAREAEVAAAEAQRLRSEQEEQQRRDEEYCRLLQAEEELSHKMALQREAEAAAAAHAQQQRDAAYRLVLQEQAALEARLADEEASIKARLEAAERQRQCEADERHARLLAAEEEARFEYEAKQAALAKEKATREAEAERLADERRRQREEMILAARIEEERLRMLQLRNAITTADYVQPNQSIPQPNHASSVPSFGYSGAPAHAYQPTQGAGSYHQQGSMPAQPAYSSGQPQISSAPPVYHQSNAYGTGASHTYFSQQPVQSAHHYDPAHFTTL